MYVQPVYTRRDGESNFPILRFVLVSYEGSVGIGTTLREAIEDSLDGGSSTPDAEPRPRRPADGVADAVAVGVAELSSRRRRRREARRPRSASCCSRRRTSSPQADEAQRHGNTVQWARLMEEGRELIEEAVRLARLTPIWGPTAAPVMFCSPTRGGAAR